MDVNAREKLATAAVLLAIVVSLLGACVVITETSEPTPRHVATNEARQ